MPIASFNTASSPGKPPSGPNPNTPPSSIPPVYNVFPAGGVGDEYAQLQPMSLAPATNSSSAVFFPGVMFEEEASNAISVHLYPNASNGRAENMGFNPTRYRVRAVLSNRIYPGATETWKPGTLFPNNPFLSNSSDIMTQLRKLLTTTTANLLFTHPIDGPVLVQVEKWSFHLRGESMRDGCFFDIEMVTTIPDVAPTDNLLPAKAKAVTKAANKCTACFNGLIPYGLNPPGMSLTAFFSTIANTILTVAANPLSVVPGLGLVLGFENTVGALVKSVQYVQTNFNSNLARNAQNALNTIGGGFFSTASFTSNNTNSSIQGTKTILNASYSKTPNNTSVITKSSTSPGYDASTANVTQSILALNGKSSQSASQFLQNTQRVLSDLQQYYINQNSIQCGPMIEALKQMNYQVLLQANTLNATSAKQASTTVVTSFVNRAPTTLVSVAQRYQQSVDDILALNPTLTHQILIPINQTIYYYQSA